MMKKVLIAGITGLIGKKLAAELRNQFNVIGLVRDINKANKIFPDFVLYPWYQKEEDFINLISNSNIVINLSGRPIAKARWTKKVKKEIYNSRIFSTRKLANLILKAPKKPELFISASAVGFYGLDINKISDEDSPPSIDFLGQVCVDWEKVSEPVENAGVRRVNLRISTVLSLNGGALPLISLPFKFFIGTYFGSGSQFFPWIHEKDLINIFKFVIKNEKIDGPVNAVSPHSVTMKEFCLTLGKILRRPCLFGIPEWVMKILFGEMSGLLTKGGRVIPKKILDAGFKFEFDNLEFALRDLFKKQI